MEDFDKIYEGLLEQRKNKKSVTPYVKSLSVNPVIVNLDFASLYPRTMNIFPVSKNLIRRKKIRNMFTDM